ncbi:MAG: AAA family ATPase [Rubrivivax sp.]|jgi:general secretion pathway protein A|nr:AAA family ATPase [Rubrivivax sp.]
MYAAHFGLEADPFSIAPDPRFLYLSDAHREALAHLLYGVGGGGGFVVLSGEVGAGKTTVCRGFLEQVPPDCEVAYIVNPKLEVIELLQTVCQEFGVAVVGAHGGAPTVRDHVDALNRHLLARHAAGRHSVLVIDEAQSLSPGVLEQLRLLTNLETAEKKLLQIVLIGQPELRAMLARPDLEQLAQRVVARYHLGALGAAETAQYVRHRLAVAGLKGPLPFDERALARLHRLAAGVPRRINLLAGRSMLGAWAQGRARIDARLVEQAAREVAGDGAPTTRSRALVPAAWALAGLATGAMAVILALGTEADERGAAAPSQAAASSPATPARPGDGPVAGQGAGRPGDAVAAAPTAAPADPEGALPQASPPRAMVDEGEAWRALASLWGLALPAGDACALAEAQQLRCWRGRGGLALVRQLDRPVVVMLEGADARRGWVVLAGVGDEQALLATADGPRTLALAELARLWKGDVATFWRPPEGWRDGLPLPALEPWLRPRLDAARQASPGLAAAPADAPLRAQVQAFQIAEGLVPDGRFGPLTAMRLAHAAGDDEPRLRALR